MHAATNHQEIRLPGKLQASSGVRNLFILMASVGLLSMVVAWMQDPKVFWPAFVHNHFYFLSLALGGLFFAVIQWVTSAMWSAPVRRLAEAFTSFLPWILVSTCVLYFGLKDLYIWTDAARVQGDLILSHKTGYLNSGFFMVRLLVAVVVWIVFARVMIGNSIRQDETKDAGLTARNRTWGPLFLILFAVSFTFTSFDLIMSLDPYWFSTMFGVYCFAFRERGLQPFAFLGFDVFRAKQTGRYLAVLVFKLFKLRAKLSNRVKIASVCGGINLFAQPFNNSPQRFRTLRSFQFVGRNT